MTITVRNSYLDCLNDALVVGLKGHVRHDVPPGRLHALMELSLPGGMKDRVALNCVLQAERRGELRPGGRIVESSSGTLAEGLARVGILLGYRVIIVTDPRMDPLMTAKLQTLGVELEVVQTPDSETGWQGARLNRLKQVLDRHPDAFWPRQYDTPDNPGAYSAIANGLAEAFPGGIQTLVASVGSGGSICGLAQALKQRMPNLRVVAVDSCGSVNFHQPDKKRLISGWGNSLIISNVDHRLIDAIHWMGDAEAFEACQKLASIEGIYAGGSSGPVYRVASWIAATSDPDGITLCVLPDRGDRYFGTIYDPAYAERNGLKEREIPSDPEELRYGVDVAQRWSFAEIPHDGSVPYVDPNVPSSQEFAASLGLSSRGR